MKVSSHSGDFEVLIKDANIDRDFGILKAQVGIWDSKICLDDLKHITTLLLRPAFLLILRHIIRFLDKNMNKKTLN